MFIVHMIKHNNLVLVFLEFHGNKCHSHYMQFVSYKHMGWNFFSYPNTQVDLASMFLLIAHKLCSPLIAYV